MAPPSNSAPFKGLGGQRVNLIRENTWSVQVLNWPWVCQIRETAIKGRQNEEKPWQGGSEKNKSN